MRSLVSGNGGKETVRILRWVRRPSPTSFKRTRASRLAEMFLKEIRRAVSFTRVQSVTQEIFFLSFILLFRETSSFSPSVEIIYYYSSKITSCLFWLKDILLNILLCMIRSFFFVISTRDLKTRKKKKNSSPCSPIIATRVERVSKTRLYSCLIEDEELD